MKSWKKKGQKKKVKNERLNFENLGFVRWKKNFLDFLLHQKQKWIRNFFLDSISSFHQPWIFSGQPQISRLTRLNTSGFDLKKNSTFWKDSLHLCVQKKELEYESMGNNVTCFCHQLQLHLNSSLKFFSLFDSSRTLHLHRIFNRFF